MRLITKEFINTIREISRGVRDDKINPHIDDAQEIDLAPLLGETLFNKIVGNPEAHAELMDGGEYIVDGTTYRQPGLKKVLAIYAYSRYILFGSVTDTAFGLVEKVSQDSKGTDASTKRNIYTKERQTAEAYFSQVANFLSRKNYPDWANNCARPSGGFNMSKITI